MFVIKIPHLDIDKIYKSKQCYRWIDLKGSRYAIPVGNKCVMVEQKPHDVFVFHCDEPQFFDLWYYYFDVFIDYSDIYFTAKAISKEMQIVMVRAKGLRVVNQDLFETIITEMINVSTNNFYKTKRILDYLCKTVGKKRSSSMGDLGQVTWYQFPDATAIVKNKNKLKESKMDYTLDNILMFCEDVESKEFDLEGFEIGALLPELMLYYSYIDSDMLLKIMLNSLYFKDLFIYNEDLVTAYEETFGTCDTDVIMDWDLFDLEGFRGVINQCIAYHVYNPINEEGEDDF